MVACFWVNTSRWSTWRRFRCTSSGRRTCCWNGCSRWPWRWGRSRCIALPAARRDRGGRGACWRSPTCSPFRCSSSTSPSISKHSGPTHLRFRSCWPPSTPSSAVAGGAVAGGASRRWPARRMRRRCWGHWDSGSPAAGRRGPQRCRPRQRLLRPSRLPGHRPWFSPPQPRLERRRESPASWPFGWPVWRSPGCRWCMWRRLSA